MIILQEQDFYSKKRNSRDVYRQFRTGCSRGKGVGICRINCLKQKMQRMHFV